MLVFVLAFSMQVVAADISDSDRTTPASTVSSEHFLFGPPKDVVPVVVSARFDLNDVNEIAEETETFQFTGVLTLQWRDSRQAFDPAIAGVDEKVFQGAYQFDELSTGWYPQVVLVNQSGAYEKTAVVLRIKPDGTSTLVETVSATAETQLNMRRFPFDGHRLEAMFVVLGFDRNEVQLQTNPGTVTNLAGEIRIPQWAVTSAEASIQERAIPFAGPMGVSSAFIVAIDVKRNSFYTTRLVVIPLIVIVLLSFSVFWMDRASLGDRTSVSFIGILTGVSYQIMVSGALPHISYATWMHGFLNLSFLTMCLTVVVNLVVGTLDKRGQMALGDRVDRMCRWVFPLTYFGLLVVMLVVTFVLF